MFSYQYSSVVPVNKGSLVQLVPGRDGYVSPVYKLGYYSGTIFIDNTFKSVAISGPNAINRVEVIETVRGNIEEPNITQGESNIRGQIGTNNWNLKMTYGYLYSASAQIINNTVFLLIQADGPVNIINSPSITLLNKSWALIKISSFGLVENVVTISGVEGNLGISYDHGTSGINICLYGLSNTNIHLNGNPLIVISNNSLYSFIINLTPNLTVQFSLNLPDIRITNLDINNNNIVYTFCLPGESLTDIKNVQNIQNIQTSQICTAISQGSISNSCLPTSKNALRIIPATLLAPINIPPIEISQVLNLEMSNDRIILVGKVTGQNTYAYYILDFSGNIITTNPINLGNVPITIINSQIASSGDIPTLYLIGQDNTSVHLIEYSLKYNTEMWSYTLTNLSLADFNYNILISSNSVSVYTNNRIVTFIKRFPALIGVVSSVIDTSNNTVMVDFVQTDALSNLIFGEEYYIDDNGNLTNVSNNNYFIGTALSASKLLMISTIYPKN